MENLSFVLSCVLIIAAIFIVAALFEKYVCHDKELFEHALYKLYGDVRLHVGRADAH